MNNSQMKEYLENMQKNMGNMSGSINDFLDNAEMVQDLQKSASVSK
jgi:hypothetical protein